MLPRIPLLVARAKWLVLPLWRVWLAVLALLIPVGSDCWVGQPIYVCASRVLSVVGSGLAIWGLWSNIKTFAAHGWMKSLGDEWAKWKGDFPGNLVAVGGAASGSSTANGTLSVSGGPVFPPGASPVEKDVLQLKWDLDRLAADQRVDREAVSALRRELADAGSEINKEHVDLRDTVVAVTAAGGYTQALGIWWLALGGVFGTCQPPVEAAVVPDSSPRDVESVLDAGAQRPLDAAVAVDDATPG